MCVIRAERQAPGRHLFTVSILRDVGACTPPWETRTVTPHEVVRLIQAFLDDATRTGEGRGDDNPPNWRCDGAGTAVPPPLGCGHGPRPVTLQ